MDRNPKTRLGAIDKQEIKDHAFFKSIDWDKLLRKEYTPPILEFENDDIEDEIEV